MRIYNHNKARLMFFKSKNLDKDFVQKIKLYEFGELRSMAKKVEGGLKYYDEWLKTNGEKLEQKILDKMKESALESDQAETPVWLRKRI